MMGKYLAIDFGTTNTSAAIDSVSGPHLIKSVEGQDMTPSVVSIDPEKMVPRVGAHALGYRDVFPQTTYFQMKRWVGVKYDANKHRGNPQIRADKNGDVAWVGPSGKLILAEDMVAMFYRDALENAGFQLTRSAGGGKPDGLVLTYPLDWDDYRQDVLRRAALKLGIAPDRIILIDEAFAAAKAYTGRLEKSANSLLIDMGGGTLDITAFINNPKAIAAKGVAGDASLGGYRFDEVLSNMAIQWFREEYGHNLRADTNAVQAMSKIRYAAEQLKIRLSYSDQEKLHVTDLSSEVPDHPFPQILMDISREEYEKNIQDLIHRFGSELEEVEQQAGWRPQDVESIYMVGGTMNTPALQAYLEDRYGTGKIAGGVDPQLAVVIGAAMKAGELEGLRDPGFSTELVNAPIGVETLNGVMRPILSRSNKVGEKVTKQLKTIEDGQTQIGVVIAQGEHDIARNNHVLGKFICDVEPAPAGEAKISVSLQRTEDKQVLVWINGQPMEMGT